MSLVPGNQNDRGYAHEEARDGDDEENFTNHQQLDRHHRHHIIIIIIVTVVINTSDSSRSTPAISVMNPMIIMFSGHLITSQCHHGHCSDMCCAVGALIACEGDASDSKVLPGEVALGPREAVAAKELPSKTFSMQL